MSSKSLVYLGLSVGLLLVGCSDPQRPEIGQTGTKTQHLINGQQVFLVVLNSGSPKAVAASVGATPTFVYRHALNGFAAPLSPQAASALAKNPHVRFLQADQPIQAIGQSVPTGVDRMDADMNPGLIGGGASVDVDVAVIDTGVYPHADLNLYRKTNCARKGPFNTSCLDGDGTDGAGHGTHVAGTIGALDNGIGVVGVAPGARIWAVRVLDNGGSGWTSWIAGGIDYVTAHAGEIEVANMSLGGSGSDDGNCGKTNNDAMHLAICNSVAAGVVYAVAAGNEAKDAASSVPASYDEVITVSALADFDGQPGGTADPALNCRSDEEQDDSLAFFSNFGADVDLMAPGYCITSTWNDGGYNTISGTSMASPHAAGLAALYMARQSVRPSPSAVQDALVLSGIPQSDPACGLATLDDPDNYAEPLAFANATIFGGDGSCGASASAGCTADADCDDGAWCNGAETCVAGACKAGSAPDCDDGNACTADSCNDVTDSCVSTDISSSCDDSDPCTTDSCDSSTGCVYTPIAGCSCAPVGALCSSDADCCSHKCRGKPGAHTCK